MKINQVNQTTAELEDFYRIDIDTAEEYMHDSFLNELIPKLAKNKAEFYTSITKKIYGMSTIKSFFSRVLEYEIKYKKDFIQFTRNEVKEMMLDMAENKVFNTRTMYNTCMGIIYRYMVWGYNHQPRLRYDIIRNKDFKFTYKDMLNEDFLQNQMLTKLGMQKIIQLLDFDMNEGLALMAMSGFEFDEALNLKKDTVENCKDCILNLGDRQLKIDENVYDKLFDLCHKETEQRLYSGGNIKEKLLADTDYVIRIIATKRAKNIPVTKSTASNNLSKDLNNAGYDGTYTDLKISSMLNDYLDGMKIEDLNMKFNVCYDKYNLPSVFGMQLKVLKKKRQQER